MAGQPAAGADPGPDLPRRGGAPRRRRHVRPQHPHPYPMLKHALTRFDAHAQPCLARIASRAGPALPERPGPVRVDGGSRGVPRRGGGGGGGGGGGAAPRGGRRGEPPCQLPPSAALPVPMPPLPRSLLTLRSRACCPCLLANPDAATAKATTPCHVLTVLPCRSSSWTFSAATAAAQTRAMCRG